MDGSNGASLWLAGGFGPSLTPAAHKCASNAKSDSKDKVRREAGNVCLRKTESSAGLIEGHRPL